MKIFTLGSWRRVLCLAIALFFTVNSTLSYAQAAAIGAEMPWMPQPGTLVNVSEAYTPAHLKGMVIHPNDPFKFDFIIHRGDQLLEGDAQQAEYQKLIKYFLAALATPDTDQWVNLSPYEQDRIIPDNFGLTGMGRDLLAQDYLLKQIASSLTNPDSDLGRKFWDGVYSEAYQKFGTTDIPTDTFNKVWIIPDKAVVYEKDNTVYVLENHLKVLLDSDYTAMKANKADTAETAQDKDAVQISKQVMRDVIIPAIEKEVNEGKNFAPVRQVYSGMLLATWYKRALKESILTKVYGDRSKVKGIDQDPATNQEIYQKYIEAFKAGAFNMIKEDVDRYSQEVIPRKYFSGGLQGYNTLEKFDEATPGQFDGAMRSTPVAGLILAAVLLMTPDARAGVNMGITINSNNIQKGNLKGLRDSLLKARDQQEKEAGKAVLSWDAKVDVNNMTNTDGVSVITSPDGKLTYSGTGAALKKFDPPNVEGFSSTVIKGETEGLDDSKSYRVVVVPNRRDPTTGESTGSIGIFDIKSPSADPVSRMGDMARFGNFPKLMDNLQRLTGDESKKAPQGLLLANQLSTYLDQSNGADIKEQVAALRALVENSKLSVDDKNSFYQRAVYKAGTYGFRVGNAFYGPFDQGSQRLVAVKNVQGAIAFRLIESNRAGIRVVSESPVVGKDFRAEAVKLLNAPDSAMSDAVKSVTQVGAAASLADRVSAFSLRRTMQGLAVAGILFSNVFSASAAGVESLGDNGGTATTVDKLTYTVTINGIENTFVKYTTNGVSGRWILKGAKGVSDKIMGEGFDPEQGFKTVQRENTQQSETFNAYFVFQNELAKKMNSAVRQGSAGKYKDAQAAYAEIATMRTNWVRLQTNVVNLTKITDKETGEAITGQSLVDRVERQFQLAEANRLVGLFNEWQGADADKNKEVLGQMKAIRDAVKGLRAKPNLDKGVGKTIENLLEGVDQVEKNRKEGVPLSMMMDGVSPMPLLEADVSLLAGNFDFASFIQWEGAFPTLDAAMAREQVSFKPATAWRDVETEAARVRENLRGGEQRRDPRIGYIWNLLGRERNQESPKERAQRLLGLLDAAMVTAPAEINVSWGNGQVALKVRPSATPGSIRVHSIMMGNSMLPVIVDGKPKTGPLLRPGEEVQFGRELGTNLYVMIVRNQVFYATVASIRVSEGKTINVSAFIEDNTKKGGPFNITRTISNQDGKAVIQSNAAGSITMVDDGINQSQILLPERPLTFDFMNSTQPDATVQAAERAARLKAAFLSDPGAEVVAAPGERLRSEDRLHNHWVKVARDHQALIRYHGVLKEFAENYRGDPLEVIRGLLYVTRSNNGIVQSSEDLDRLLEAASSMAAQIALYVSVSRDKYGPMGQIGYFPEKLDVHFLGGILDGAVRLIKAGPNKQVFLDKIRAQGAITVSLDAAMTTDSGYALIAPRFVESLYLGSLRQSADQRLIMSDLVNFLYDKFFGDAGNARQKTLEELQAMPADKMLQMLGANMALANALINGVPIITTVPTGDNESLTIALKRIAIMDKNDPDFIPDADSRMATLAQIAHATWAGTPGYRGMDRLNAKLGSILGGSWQLLPGTETEKDFKLLRGLAAYLAEKLAKASEEGYTPAEREQLAARIENVVGMFTSAEDQGRMRKALKTAMFIHRNADRKDGQPYFKHILDVVENKRLSGATDVMSYIKPAYHDVREDEPQVYEGLKNYVRKNIEMKEAALADLRRQGKEATDEFRALEAKLAEDKVRSAQLQLSARILSNQYDLTADGEANQYRPFMVQILAEIQAEPEKWADLGIQADEKGAMTVFYYRHALRDPQAVWEKRAGNDWYNEGFIRDAQWDKLSDILANARDVMVLSGEEQVAYLKKIRLALNEFVAPTVFLTAVDKQTFANSLRERLQLFQGELVSGEISKIEDILKTFDALTDAAMSSTLKFLAIAGLSLAAQVSALADNGADKTKPVVTDAVSGRFDTNSTYFLPATVFRGPAFYYYNAQTGKWRQGVQRTHRAPSSVFYPAGFGYSTIEGFKDVDHPPAGVKVSTKQPWEIGSGDSKGTEDLIKKEEQNNRSMAGHPIHEPTNGESVETIQQRVNTIMGELNGQTFWANSDDIGTALNYGTLFFVSGAIDGRLDGVEGPNQGVIRDLVWQAVKSKAKFTKVGPSRNQNGLKQYQYKVTVRPDAAMTTISVESLDADFSKDQPEPVTEKKVQTFNWKNKSYAGTLELSPLEGNRTWIRWTGDLWELPVSFVVKGQTFSWQTAIEAVNEFISPSMTDQDVDTFLWRLSDLTVNRNKPREDRMAEASGLILALSPGNFNKVQRVERNFGSASQADFDISRMFDAAMSVEEMRQVVGPNHKTLAEMVDGLRENGVTEEQIDNFISYYSWDGQAIAINADGWRITKFDQYLKQKLTDSKVISAIFNAVAVIFYKEDGTGRNFRDETYNYIEAVYAALKATASPQGSTGTDSAMTKGGIDFAQSNLDLQIKRDGAGVPLPISQQNLDSLRIDGLVPVILDIKPAASIPLFANLAS